MTGKDNSLIRIMQNKVKGAVLFEKLVISKAVDELNNMIKGIEQGRWVAEDAEEVLIVGKDGQLEKVGVMTPHHEAGVVADPEELFYAVICGSQEFILNTLDGWKRTGYIMKFKQ